MTPAQAFEKQKERERRLRDEETIRQLRHELRIERAQNDCLRELLRLTGNRVIKAEREAREVL